MLLPSFRSTTDCKLLRQERTESRAWPPEEEIEKLFQKSDEKSMLQREFFSAKMLVERESFASPERAQNKIKDWIVSNPAPCGLEWDAARDMPWLEVPVPVYYRGKNEGDLAWLLLGLRPEGETESLYSFDDKKVLCTSIEAIKNALRLATEQTGRTFVCTVRHSSSEMQGDSLGLPVWLAAMVLAEIAGRPEDEASLRQAFRSVLASGALDKNGKLTPVEGVDKKATMCRFSDARRFLYCGTSLLSDRFCFPVSNKEDAWFLLKCSDEKVWNILYSLGRDLKAFWEELLPVIASTWMKDKAKVSQALIYGAMCGFLKEAPDCCENSEYLGHACTLMENKMGRDEFLPLFPYEWAKDQKASVALFRLCQLQITQENHRGMVQKKGEGWETLAKKCREVVEDCGARVEPYFLESDARTFVRRHNAFDFRSFREAEQELLSRCAKIDYTDISAGKAYGTLCQCAAFRGDKEAESLALLSIEKFGNTAKGKEEAVRRNADLAYIYWDKAADCDEAAKAEQYVRTAEGYVEKYIADCGEDNFRFAEALKARKFAERHLFAERRKKTLADRAIELDVSARKAMAEDIIKEGKTIPHPWHLFFYNSGIALQDASLLEFARKLFCLEKEGSTLRVMELLPLSRLVTMENFCSDAEERAKEVLKEIRMAVDGGALDKEHFRDLLEVENDNALAALAMVRDNTRKYFPFSYR